MTKAPIIEREPRAYASSRAETGTLGKAVDILETISNAPNPLRFTDILAKSDLPRGTLHRLLRNLAHEGLVSVGPNQNYTLGLRILRFASRAWAGNDFRKIAEPHLRTLHAETGETVHLGVVNGTEVVYLDKVESLQAVRMHSQIGNASPLHCTGVGKAALSAADDAWLDRLLPQLTYRQFTAATVPDSAALRAEIATIRAWGHAFDREEHEDGIRCVAAPIHSLDRSFLAGVSVTGPAYRISQSTLEGWAEQVRATARAIMDDMQTRLGPRA